MNKQFKKALQSAFEAPIPVNKAQFLKNLHYPQIIYRHFLLSQLRYIRKRVWVFSVLTVLLGWIITFQSPMFLYWKADEIKIWSISSILPFLSMMTVLEIYRSTAYHMAELEGSCRFSLPQIIMARMGILGVANSVVLISLLVFINQVSAYSLLQTISYIMVPYLIVCAICLWILNRTRGQSGIYGCAAAAGLISGSSILCESMAEVFYSDTCLKGWLILLVCCLVLIGVQMRKLIKQMEEKQWNLSLTE